MAEELAPVVTKTTYAASRIKQLVDINQATTNFRATFTLTSAQGKPFEAVIVPQRLLDSEGELEFQPAPGQLSAEIVRDRNIYEHYFLVFRSEEPMMLDFEMTFQPLPEQTSTSALFQPPSLIPTDWGYAWGLFKWGAVAVVLGWLAWMWWSQRTGTGGPALTDPATAFASTGSTTAPVTTPSATDLDIAATESLLTQLKQIPIE
jgi:hypothetical protein